MVTSFPGDRLDGALTKVLKEGLRLSDQQRDDGAFATTCCPTASWQ